MHPALKPNRAGRPVRVSVRLASGENFVARRLDEVQKPLPGRSKSVFEAAGSNHLGHPQD